MFEKNRVFPYDFLPLIHSFNVPSSSLLVGGVEGLGI
jgi:hypothetical protein